MPKTVTIGSNPHIIPEQNDNPGWGEGLTGWIDDVTDTLTIIQGPNDILITSATLQNNQSSVANIAGLLINVSAVESIELTYTIKREFDSGSVLMETGKILGTYDGTTFTISQEATGDAGVDISVTNAGQFQYTSSNLTAHTSSLIRFKVQTIDTP